MISLSLPSPAPPSFKPPNPNPKPHKPKTLKPSSSNPLHNRPIHHLDQAQLNKAISTLDLMSHHNSAADLLTYSLLLKSCIRFRNFELGKLLHKKLTNSGLELDSVLLNSLITLYSKSGDPVTASLVFEEMGERKRDLVSWSSLISCYANNDMEFEAIVKFIDMIELGFCPNEYSFCAVIKACSVKENVWIGKIILGFVIKSGFFDTDVCVGCALIDMFVNGGCDLESAKKVFDKMPERNAVTWTLMITRYMQMGQASDALELFLDMVVGGNAPDQFTFSGVISACAKLGMLSLGKQLHSQVIRLGLVSDVCVGCSLIDMYAKCMVDGTMVDSRRVFDGMSEHNVMSWTAIITGYVGTGGCDKEAIELFSEMICGQTIPNHFTFSAVLKACTNLSDLCLGEQVYTHAVKLGLASVNCVGNSLVSMYARCGWMENARKAFDILFEKNLVSYNAIVDGYAKNLDSDEAFKLYGQIEDTGFEVDIFTFASLLSGAASIGAIGVGTSKQLFKCLMK
ncbi:Pentatricopeptide repeat [Dillenia turbinata]|uniref:Pentatricopeptide repeat n=1 Tax=Dillenia turbinata TaxID=194707 RepID=A0AAN8VYQ4_9MAGN